LPDYVGMFACTAGIGLEELIHGFKEVGQSFPFLCASSSKHK
jgi:hypothetical protein